jgi:hypothetical protein
MEKNDLSKKRMSYLNLGLMSFTRSFAHLERGLLWDDHERFVIGFQYRSCCQDLEQIITFKKNHSIAHPNDPIGFLSYFVDKPSVLCRRWRHVKPPGG